MEVDKVTHLIQISIDYHILVLKSKSTAKWQINGNFNVPNVIKFGLKRLSFKMAASVREAATCACTKTAEVPRRLQSLYRFSLWIRIYPHGLKCKTCAR